MSINYGFPPSACISSPSLWRSGILRKGRIQHIPLWKGSLKKIQVRTREVGPVSFEEVAVYFSEGEWSQLDPDQKALHWEIMLENHRNMASLGNDGQENKDSGEPFQVIIAGDRMETSAIGMEIERDEKNQPDSWN
ncbi:PREDICTED: zinc finger protein 766-like isoform X2 [Thamnophis sirtalis]|uniref:Zinc finger protein 766-like isoform X2 n=1 Tax=Thamnophis sirtalis TaxID=35019 RepID=A0A6I9YKZ7_9SAUR|nr:PREDICTED: zinc finger protein 766-like isoform X2 [Thamnophis sirtalis]